MKAGVCTIAFNDRPPEAAVEIIARSGATGTELWGRPPHLPGDRAARARLVRRLRDAGLELCALGSYYRPDGRLAGGQAGPTPYETGSDPAYVLDAACDLGAPLLRIWAGNADYDACAPDDRERIVDEIRLFAERARARGVAVVLERHTGTLTNGWESAGAVVAAVAHPSVSLCYQVPYPVPADELRTRVADDIARHLPCSRHAHLQNYVEAHDGSLPRTLLGEGIVDYGPLGEVAATTGYDAWAMVEFIGPVRGELDEAAALAADVRFIAALGASQ